MRGCALTVMNTIPLIFNEKKVSHTIIGGTVKKSIEEHIPLTVILLNRGGRYYRSAVFQNLENAGFTSIISVEMANEPYDIESLSARFPSVKFLLPLEKVTIGEMINTAAAEIESDYFFVVWNDMKITPASLPARVLQRQTASDLFCMAPVLSSQRMEALPVQMVPALKGNSFDIEPMLCYRDGSRTAYPFDFTGIYNRTRFISLGGFDHSIRNAYWQNLDLGFRAHLWGESIEIATGFRILYDSDIPKEDITPDSSYFSFYLKNLAPVLRAHEAFLPWSRFYTYATHSGRNILSALRVFLHARRWISINRNRFVHDAATMTARWEPNL